jgi:galactokinase
MLLDQKIVITQAPGRINIIGEHTDYNDGFVLPAAIDKKTIFKLCENQSDAVVNIKASNLSETFSFDLNDFRRLENGWQNYIMGVVNELQKKGIKLRGFDAEFEGTVPIGSGMSSSASLECGFILAINELFDLNLSADDMIKMAQAAEHNFVGIKCGIMDQFASMMGKKNQVILLDCRTLDYQYFPLELGRYQILLLNSNVSHTLASSEYNVRRADCEEGISLLKKTFPEIINLRDLTLSALTTQKEQLPEKIYRRCHHVVSENERVLVASDALVNGDTRKLGKLMYASHSSLQNDYEVSCPELDFLVEQTKDKDYVLGSRMMGGGFGGCTINIVEKKRVEEFIDSVSRNYYSQYGLELASYSVSIEDGAMRI